MQAAKRKKQVFGAMRSSRAEAGSRRLNASNFVCASRGRVAERSATDQSVACGDVVIDLHCHILPGIDDGAKNLDISLEMARLFAADGVTHVACTPHILPGVWTNTGPQIRSAVANLQAAIDAAGIELYLVPGADNHVVPDFVAGLQEGRLLTLGDSRYVLVEPPHHVAPPRLEEFFFGILVAGYVPILTHPERLTWIEGQYAVLKRLVDAGVWMQVTAGSLAGRFGKRAQALGLRMLEEGLVHILATDAHDPERRPPLLSEGWQIASERVGAAEAERLVLQRPFAILHNDVLTPEVDGAGFTSKQAGAPNSLRVSNLRVSDAYVDRGNPEATEALSSDRGTDGGWLSRRLRRLIE